MYENCLVVVKLAAVSIECRCSRGKISSRKDAAAAKSLQSCPTLSDPMDCSLPGSSVHGIFQARVLEWVAIAVVTVNTLYKLIFQFMFNISIHS